MDKRHGQYVIDQIRQKYRISEYLDEKGFLPKKRQGNRWSYLCPIHNESNPSFSLYLAGSKSDYDNYFCFSCKKSGDIISLTAELDYGGGSSRNWGAAIRHLSKGLNLTVDGEVDFIIDQIKKQWEGNTKKAEEEESFFEILSLQISALGSKYLQQTNYDCKEKEFLESVYKKVDEYVTKYDLDSLKQAYEFIVDNGAFDKRYEEYLKQQDEKLVRGF